MNRSLLLLALAPLLLRAETTPVFLHAIETQVVGDLHPGQSLHADLYVVDPQRIASGMPDRAEVAANADFVRVALGAYPELALDSSDLPAGPSFVVDFDDPAVTALSQQAQERFGETPTVEELTSFVHDAIAEKTTIEGWLIASEAARRLSGDCTEHAVLLAALARAAGMPARVVIGAALVRHAEGASAFGHAWTEIAVGSRWLPADATGISDLATVHYLRAAALEDEGLGYMLGLVALLREVGIQRVVVAPD